MLQECYYGKTIRVYTVTQYSVDTVMNKEVKDKILAKTMPVLRVLSTLRAKVNFLKWQVSTHILDFFNMNEYANMLWNIQMNNKNNKWVLNLRNHSLLMLLSFFST